MAAISINSCASRTISGCSCMIRETRATAAIDAPDAAPILAALAAREWDADRYSDHAPPCRSCAGHPRPQGAISARPRRSDPRKEAAKIGGLDVDGRRGRRGRGRRARSARDRGSGPYVSGHVAYWFEEEDLVFVGDTLFAMGCGRGFEEPPPVLFHSLMKLAALPGETKVYCGHEYTLANAQFALSVDPDNGDLARAREGGREAARGGRIHAADDDRARTRRPILFCAPTSRIFRPRSACRRRSGRGLRRIARPQEPGVSLQLNKR